MRAVGIRELKSKLREYIRLVEAGESILVTDRGTVVAEIRAPGASTLPPEHGGGLAELARAGRATLGAPHDPALYRVRPRAVEEGVTIRLLDAERGDR
jgi:antitoxin (DNA-binding transcriptional repressor) of toxin-antitoxin stability system